jgi:hypothetical protein
MSFWDLTSDASGLTFTASPTLDTEIATYTLSIERHYVDYPARTVTEYIDVDVGACVVSDITLTTVDMTHVVGSGTTSQTISGVQNPACGYTIDYLNGAIPAFV